MLEPVRRTEWLLAPLFFLPFALAAAFCLYVRHDYRAELAAARAGAAALDLDVRDAGRKFAEAWPGREQPGDTVIDWDGVPMRVRLAARVPHRWVFRSDFPGSVTAQGIADPAVRIDVERGVAPARLEAIAERARIFAELHARPDLRRLASAPLPVETKAYLLSRTPGGSAAAPLLAALSAHGPAKGLHGAQGAWLGRPGRQPLHSPSHRPIELSWLERDRGRLRLVYSTAPIEGLAPWRVEKPPLAGHWVLRAVHGDAWWRDALFARWAAPVGLAALALLVFPALAFAAIRRQRALDGARVRFLTEIAHDLRTPLTALRLQAELFERDVPGAPRARRVAGEAAKLSHLLANLLDLTRLERGARHFDVGPIDVPALMGDAARDFRAAHPERANDLALEGPPATARGDTTALRRCVANLLDNAGKHTAAGTPVRVAWESIDGRVRIDVADDGDGIAVADRDRLFRRYHRGARARTDAVPGTGLGLALVRELARGMGGDAVLLPSECGARFRVEVPRA